MRALKLVQSAIAAAILLSPFPPRAIAQEPPAKPPPDEFRALVKMVEEAYKAPFEVEKDVLDELRKQYREATPDREAKILREVRRAYATTPDREEAIVRELRRAYRAPSAQQETRVFEEIRRGGPLTPGTIPPDAQVERAARMFRKLDRNADGVLNSDEMPEFLRSKLRDWDRNRDGMIDANEYLAYFQSSLQWVAERVASGEIPIKLPKEATPIPPPETTSWTGAAQVQAPTVQGRQPQAQPQLPDWFTRFDEDGDGQVGLYEWKKAGRPIAEFLEMDRNHDGFLEAKELLAFLAEHPSPAAGERKRR
jgi:Ca2+-binding EF-hand superfamily protein